jgi:hypothetical protein
MRFSDMVKQVMKPLEHCSSGHPFSDYWAASYRNMFQRKAFSYKELISFFMITICSLTQTGKNALSPI